MGLNSGIEWTDHTWNPWQGCHPVSIGCKNCYMFREKKRWGQDPSTVVRSSKRTFNMPLRLPKEPAKVFTCSWSDFFIEEADKWRRDAWKIIANTPYLTYLILTKRAERMNWIIRELEDEQCSNFDSLFSNVALGITAENQDTFDKRIEWLIRTKSAMKFVSAEPMLGQIDMELTDGVFYDAGIPVPWQRLGKGRGINWVICGGETGPRAREMKTEWARDLYRQCKAAGVPFFFKKPGDAFKGNVEDLPMVREWPKVRRNEHKQPALPENDPA